LGAPFIGCPLSDAKAGFWVYNNPLQPHLNLKISFFFKNKQIFSTSLKMLKTLFPTSTSKLLSTSFLRGFSTSVGRASQLPSLPKIVTVSPEEKAQGSLTWKNLELANRALHHDSLVVLENAISHEKLDLLNQKMVDDAKMLQAKGDESPYGYNKGSVPNSPPRPQTN
jgi:hypothetical protein